MPDINNAEIIDYEPDEQGNRYYILATAKTRRGAIFRSRIELSEIAYIRDMKSINVESVENIYADVSVNKVLPDSTVIETETTKLTNISEVDVRKLYEGVLSRIGRNVGWNVEGDVAKLVVPRDGVRGRFTERYIDEYIDFNDTYLVTITTS